MPDIATNWNTTRGDWALAGQDLASGTEIVTAVLISIFTDRVATPDDVVPDASRRLRDPRGWWGDVGQYRIGSRLWLLDRAKKTQGALALAQGYITEALQWLVDDGIASRIEVGVEWTRDSTLGAQVVVYSPRNGVPLVKVGTQNVFRLPDAQAWGWNTEQLTGQWVELEHSTAAAVPPPFPPFVGDLDLDSVINTGPTSAIGKSLNLDPLGQYSITLPVGRIYTAWSYNTSQVAYNTLLQVTTSAGTQQLGGAGVFSTAAAARAAFPGIVFAGASTVTFWLYDAGVLSDNAGGLSLHVTRIG